MPKYWEITELRHNGGMSISYTTSRHTYLKFRIKSRSLPIYTLVYGNGWKSPFQWIKSYVGYKYGPSRSCLKRLKHRSSTDQNKLWQTKSGREQLDKARITYYEKNLKVVR